ncbi:MAG: hypothetical protein ACUVWP_03955 [bacterium]
MEKISKSIDINGFSDKVIKIVGFGLSNIKNFIDKRDGIEKLTSYCLHKE